MNTDKDQFNPASFEEKWRKMWEKKQVYKTEGSSDEQRASSDEQLTTSNVQRQTSNGSGPEPKTQNSKPKSYILDMYPYPSGSGLHVGHPRGYLGTDVIARFERMRGKSVMHPMGFDSFGLPAENYAIKSGMHPQKTTDDAIETFKKQIEKIGLSYDWSKELSVHRPDYYKWTQWIFLQLYKKGLAYKKKAPVNWCPKDNTVLANEQVIDGKCERCDSEVIQKDMNQWFFKITDYADRLLEGLDRIDWPQSTKLGQINWIGKSEGAIIKFKIQASNSKEDQYIEVFTTRADTIYSAAFVVLAPENPLIETIKDLIINIDEVEKYIHESKGKTELERQQQKDKTGVKIVGLMAVNPINNKEVPIYIGDFVLGGYGTGAVFGDVHDERDFEFVKKFNIEATPSIVPEEPKLAEKVKNLEVCFADYGILINSDEFTGMRSEEALPKIVEKLEKQGAARKQVNYRLRDWLVSRQRYWGAPIPIVYDPEGNAHPVDESDLPVLLPTDVDFKPTGESPLNYSETFHKSAEEKYGKGWRREVDTMDTFVDSSWYFFRFADVNNDKIFADTEKMNYWLPIDLYVGGAEHTVLHLLYARFFTKVFYDLGYVNFDEPFQKLRHQGTILASDNRKMSKRWGNVINPDDEIAKYGADTLRIYEMFMGPFESTMPWNTKTEVGVFRFLGKVWEMQNKIKNEKLKIKNEGFKDGDDVIASEAKQSFQNQEVEINKLIKKVTKDIETMSFNTSIAKMMEFVNFLKTQESIERSVWERFLLVLAPFGPYIAEELWFRLGNEFSVTQQKWPSFDESLTVDSTVKIAIQINGKVRGTVEISPEATEEEVMTLAKSQENISKYITSDPKKVIYVKGRILNIIV